MTTALIKTRSEDLSLLDVALSYVRSGIPIFPCREETTEGIDTNTGEIVDWIEKSPYTGNGLHGATKSERIIKIWWGERHPYALIGMPTGGSSGVWVLDLDKHGDRDGHTWLAEMEAMHGALPETARAKTANGGTHIFFNHVDGVRNRAAIAPGVDTRGDGGYICSPGSTMADGRRYEWENFFDVGFPDVADAPQWLLDLVVSRPAPEVSPRYEYTYTPGKNERYVESALKGETEKVAGAAEGNRGAQLFSSACALGELVAAGALSRDDAEGELYRAAVACGVAQKDGERKTMDRIRRGLDKTKSAPREIPDRPANDNDTPLQNNTIAALIAGNRENEATTIDAPHEETEQQLPAKKKRERFEKTWFDDIVEGEPKETFIKGVFGVREFTTISGLPGTGKSVVVTDAACHVAAGMDWHGRKVRQGFVVYVAAERKKLTERRMMAFRKKHNVEGLPLLVLGGRLDFTKNLDDAKALIAEIKGAEIITGTPCIWVIIDTLTRVFGAGDQNASKDMSKFVQSCDEILASTEAHVTAIHHAGWNGERGKGAIDLDGAVDASFMVKKDHGKYKLICDGTNDGEEGDIITFTMESVPVGVDEDGEVTTAPVVQPSTEGGITGMLGNKTHKEKALSVLLELLEIAGEDTPATPGFPDVGKVIPEDVWREAFYEALGDMVQPSKQATFKRALKQLEKGGHIGKQGVWVWPTTSDE